MRIALCLPVHNETKALYTASVLALVCHTLAERPDIRIAPFMVRSSALVANRNSLVRDALKAGSDALLLTDVDHTFPKDALLRLVARNVDIVGVNYLRRDGHTKPVAEANGHLVMTVPQSEAMMKVDHTGLGFCLVRREVFETIGDPWFEGQYEDAAFFTKCREAGFDVWVDHELSREVGHIAETVLTFR